MSRPALFFVIVLAGACALAPAAAAGESAPAGALGAGTHTLQLSHDGQQRKYLLHIPAGYDPARPAPLVLAFHGGGGHAEFMADEARYGLVGKAERAGFVVVFPNGYSRFYAGIPPVGDARTTPALDHPLQTYDQIGATASGPWTHIGVYWQQPDEFIDGFGGLHSSSLVDRWNRKYWWICENVPSSNPGAIISIDIDGLPVDIDPVTHKPAGLRRYGCSLSSTEGEAPVAAIVPHADDVDSSGAAKPDDELAAGFVRTYIVRISTDISIASAYKVIVVPLFGLTEETNIKPQIARYHTTQSDGSRSVDGSALHGHYLAPGLQYHHASRALVLCNPGRTGTYGTAGDFAGELRALAVPDDPMNAVEADWRWRIVSVDGTNGVATPSASQQSVFRGTYGKSGIIDDMGHGQSLLYCVTTWDVPTFVCKLPVGGV